LCFLSRLAAGLPAFHSQVVLGRAAAEVAGRAESPLFAGLGSSGSDLKPPRSFCFVDLFWRRDGNLFRLQRLVQAAIKSI